MNAPERDDCHKHIRELARELAYQVGWLQQGIKIALEHLECGDIDRAKKILRTKLPEEP